MSSSKTLSNLNIRKYPSYESYKASTPGPDDLCVVDENGDLLLQVQTLPTASAAYDGRIVQQKSDGYFYKCVSDGQDPATYSWVQTNTLQNTATGTNALSVGNGTTAAGDYSIAMGRSSSTGSNAAGGVAIGALCSATQANAIAVGINATASGQGAIQLSTASVAVTNSDANTFKVALGATNYELMSSDGTIPEARLADTTGASQGDVLTLDANGDAVWAAGGGGGSAPIAQATSVATAPTADNESLSVGNGARAGDENGSGTNACLAVGINAVAAGTSVVNATAAGYNSRAAQNATSIGANAGKGSGARGVSIGANMQAGEGGILIGSATSATSGGDDEFDVCFSDWMGTKHLYPVMNSSGNLFADRLASTTGLADGNYRLRLTMASGVPTLSWVAE